MPIDLRHVQEIKERLPFPLYCTHLMDGGFKFVNQPFLTLLGFTESDLARVSANVLYSNEIKRKEWIREIKHSRYRAKVAEYNVYNSRPGDGHRATVHVLDAALVIENQEGIFALGVLIDLNSELRQMELANRRIQAYREILELIDVGVHEIDHNGRLIFMNRFERQLLDVDSKWIDEQPEVSLLSNGNPQETMLRVMAKIKDGHVDGNEAKHLTRGDHRTFVRPASVPHDKRNQAKPAIVPVNIFDIPILESDPSANRRNHEIFTVVAAERIPDDIKDILRDLGPRNPVLEAVGISTFIKETRKYASTHITGVERPATETTERELIFTYGNDLFVGELIEITKRNPEIGVTVLADVIGRPEPDLWPKHADSYADADSRVLNDPTEDERIEKHPVASGQEVDVQVFKMPYVRDGGVVGVVGFYWQVGGMGVAEQHDQIRMKLRKFYRPEDVLREIGVSVLMKDREHRFVYGNDAYINDLKGLRGKLEFEVKSLDDIIGLRDIQLFKNKKDAGDYENDEDKLFGKRENTIEHSELHGERRVWVVKKPIRHQREIVGVQGVYWYEGSKNPHGIHVEWRPPKPLLIVGSKSVEIRRKQPWYLFDCLLKHLNQFVEFSEIAKQGQIIENLERNEIDKLGVIRSHLLNENGGGVLATAVAKLEWAFGFEIDRVEKSYRLRIVEK